MLASLLRPCTKQVAFPTSRYTLVSTLRSYRMSAELPRYEYRLGFRYAANVRSIETGQCRTRSAVAPLERIGRLQQDSLAATNRRPTKPAEAGAEAATVRTTSYYV